MYIWSETIFYWLVLIYKQKKGEQVIPYLRALVCYCSLDPDLSDIANFYKYQKVFQCKSLHIESLLRKTIMMTFYLPSYCSTINVHSPEPLVLLHRSGVLSVYCWLGICFEFLFMFDVCIMENTTLLVNCIRKRVKCIFFAVSIKFCDESGLAISKLYKTNTLACISHLLPNSFLKKFREQRGMIEI